MVYPHERQVEYWISREIDGYFENEGYQIVVLPNSPRLEKHIPYDHLFAGRGVKVFGFQYKRLYRGSSDYWQIDVEQYNQLARFDWIYYALPQIRSIRESRNALHLVSIATARSLQPIVAATSSRHANLSTTALGMGNNKVSYYRWGGFIQNLFGCRIGWKPKHEAELRAILADTADLLQTLVDLYIIPLRKGPAVRISPFLAPLNDNQSEQGFDFGVENPDDR